MKNDQCYAAPTVGMPFERMDSQKLTETVTAIRASEPVQDRTTADDLRWALTQLTERRDFHEALRERYTGELREVEEKRAAKENALATLQKMVAVRPALRHEIAEVRYDIERLVIEAADLGKEVAKHTTIRDREITMIEAFDHDRLARMEAEEKVLQEAGL